MFLGLLPLLLFRRAEVLASSFPKQFLLLGLFWLFGQTVTDVIRHTPVADYARGLSKIGMMLINFMALYILLADNRRRIILFTVGWAIGTLISVLRSTEVIAEEDSWKFGKGIAITVLIILITLLPMLRRTPLLQPSVMAGLGVLALAEQSRNLCGCCLLAAAYLALQQWMSRHNTRRTLPTAQNQIILLLTVVIVIPVIFSGYAYAASTGLLGDKAKLKYELQTRGGNVITGGRDEILVSIQAIKDSPIIGHGSWAKDRHYIDLLAINLRAVGAQKYMVKLYTTGLIPTHSHLFGGWVEAGIAGGIFWLYTIWFTLRVLGRFYMTSEPFSPLIVFFAVIFLWDVVFSPFGNERRISVPFIMILLMFAWDTATRGTEVLPKAHVRSRNAPNMGLQANIRLQTGR